MNLGVRHVHLQVKKKGQFGHTSDEHIQNIRAVVLSNKELERLKSHSDWLAKQSHDANQRQKRMEHLKLSSQNIVKKWNNTVLNKQKERLERRLERLQKEEDRKNAIYHASLQEAAENRKKIVEDARRLILFDRDDIHQVNSSFVFSEVLHEREKQVEFKKHLKDIEEKERLANAEKIRHDTEVYKELEAERTVKEHEAKMERKAQNIKMMKEKAENEALLLSSEKEHEKQDLLDMEAEIRQVKENIEKEIQRKKEHVKRDALESIKLKLERDKMSKQEEEDEDKVIQIYCRVKQKMECIRQKKESEAHQAKKEQQERIKAIIAESLKEKEDDIDSMINKALQEREQRETEKLKKRQEYEAKLLKERRDYMIEVQNRKIEEEREDKQQKQWIVMQRLKRDEIDKMTELKKKESQWATKMAVRLGYNSQIEKQQEMREKECLEEKQQHDYIMKKNLKEDNDFFTYAAEVLEECKATSRPLYPVQKVINDYKKRNGIIQREKYEKWLTENAELEKYKQEDDSVCQQLEFSRDSPVTEMKFFQPLMKKCHC